MSSLPSSTRACNTQDLHQEDEPIYAFKQQIEPLCLEQRVNAVLVLGHNLRVVNTLHAEILSCEY